MRRGTRGRGYSNSNWQSAPNRSQNNIPKLLQPPQNAIQTLSTPLMTDHLQGLKDIDMELELLKRKRQIIEQQQQILTNSYRNDYEQPMFNQTRQSRYDDFASLYNNPRDTEHYGGGGSHSGRDDGSRKRTHIPIWDNEVPSKRLSTLSKGVKKTFGSRLGPAPNQSNAHRAPEPRFAAPKPPRRPPPPPQKKKEFNPTKVSKPSTAPPLKLVSYQPAERKRLVTEALASGAARPAVDSALILRADRDPSHVMVGRMELALGAIIKDVKNANPQHERVFKQPHVLRAMKQYIRDRIHTAMVGKPVTNAEEVKHAYYDMFPTGDQDVALKGLMANENKEFKAVDAVNPEMYFKKNIRNLMILKMDEMIGKLQEIYCGRKQFTNKLGWSKNQNAVPNLEAEPTEGESSKDEADANTKLKSNEILDDEKNKPEIKGEIAENIPEQDDTKTVDVATVKETNTNKTAIKHTPIASKIVIPKDLINNEHYLCLDRLLTFKMLHLIKRYTPEFVKSMDSDVMYRKAKAAITAETAKKLTRNKNKPDAMEEGLASEVAENDPPKQAPEKRLSNLHYVKILGKPSLPKRKAMESFFDQFKPKSIKKHRTIHNLLFAGFLEKESFDQILAADGICIGRFTLDIKVSERNYIKKNQDKPDQAPLQSEGDKFNDSSDIIGSELDDQITDLLTSIKKSQEFENFHDDVVMTELPPINENDVKKDNEEHFKKDTEIEYCGAEQIANNAESKGNIASNKVTQIDVDIVEIKDIPQNDEHDVVEVKDVPQDNDSEVIHVPLDNDNEVIHVPQDDNNVVEHVPQDNKNEVEHVPQDDKNEVEHGPQDNNKEVQNVPQGDDNEDKYVPQDDICEGTEKAQNDGAIKNQPKPDNEVKTMANDDSKKTDTLGPLKTEKSLKATPTRASARLATPSTIRTRRTSKLE